jgi:hypothetical protein
VIKFRGDRSRPKKRRSGVRHCEATITLPK